MKNKYQKYKYQIYTNGQWVDEILDGHTIEVAGELIEEDSPDCNDVTWQETDGYICEDDGNETIKRWVTTGNFICEGFTKYSEEKEIVSYDSGESWSDTGNTRAGRLVETNSEYCGYEPPSDIKALLLLSPNVEISVPTDGSSELTASEVSAWKNETYKLTVLSSVTSIGNNCMSYSENLATVVLSDETTNLGAGCFAYTRSLILFDFKNITDIGAGSFAYGGLVRADLTNVETIGNEAFAYNQSLRIVDIGENCESIGDSCFSQCRNLNEIYVRATMPPNLGNFVFYQVPSYRIYVPAECLQIYKNDWQEYSDNIFAIE